MTNKATVALCIACMLASNWVSAQGAIGTTPLPTTIFNNAGTLLQDLERPKATDLDTARWARAFGYTMASFDRATYSRINSVEAFRTDPSMRERLLDPATRTSLASLHVCADNSVTGAQVEAVVIKFIRDNPARWNQRAHLVVEDALKTAFPCSPDIFKPQ